jgi:hypothetical protein
MSERVEQLTLPLFDIHPVSALSIGSQQATSGSASAPPSFADVIAAEGHRNLSVVLCRRLKRSWRVVRAPFTRQLTLSVPSRYEKAPAEIKHALLHWATLALVSRRSRENRRARRDLEKIILSYASAEHPAPVNGRRLAPASFDDSTRGAAYDLAEIFASVNQRCFGGGVASKVRWGTFATTTSYQSTKKDLSDAPFSLITIAGVYNHPGVPRYAVEAVMHHEMLHVVMPPTIRNGRRQVHPAAFREAERRFPEYRQWHSWEHAWLHRLAREMRKRPGKFSDGARRAGYKSGN